MPISAPDPAESNPPMFLEAYEASLFVWYERYIPFAIRKILRVVIRSPRGLLQFVSYIGIGIITVCVDFGILAVLLQTTMPLSVSVSIAYLVAASVQFSLNRYQNFRNFDRSVAQQIRTTIAIGIFVWIFTVIWVGVLVQWFEIPALVAKALSIPITVIIGFLSFRFLIFGPGISHRIRRWLSK